MTDYRRFYIPKTTWFFTVNLAERKNNHLLVEKINELRDAFRYVMKQKPFLVMPDHLHCIWTLPQDDGDYSIRWNMLKGRFSRTIDHGESISKSRQKRRERGIWQRRFWAHLITDQDDYNRHFDYIHWNPVKHSKVARVAEWPYSSFHRYVRQGIYSENWGNDERYEIEDAEYSNDALHVVQYILWPFYFNSLMSLCHPFFIHITGEEPLFLSLIKVNHPYLWIFPLVCFQPALNLIFF